MDSFVPRISCSADSRTGIVWNIEDMAVSKMDRHHSHRLALEKITSHGIGNRHQAWGGALLTLVVWQERPLRWLPLI